MGAGGLDKHAHRDTQEEAAEDGDKGSHDPPRLGIGEGEGEDAAADRRIRHLIVPLNR